MKFKVCGMTRREDLALADLLGFDYTGFIFYPPSPRYIAPERVKQIAGAGEKAAVRVGVFVDTPAEQIQNAAARAGLGLIQLHGGEDRTFCDSLELPWWKALRIRGKKDVEMMDSFEGATVLLDAYAQDKPGGTGKRIQQDLVEAALVRAQARGIKLILAGGLTEESVALLEELPLWGADFNSGLEESPGRKDPNKMRRLMERAVQLKEKHCGS